MAKYIINTLQLTREVFGIAGVLPRINKATNPEINIEGTEITTIELAETTASSVFGTPVFDSLTLIDGDAFYKFLDAPLMDVNKSKHIVKSKVQGFDGTVKEFISDNDFMIRIRGVLTNDSRNDLPFDEVEALNQIVDRKVSLDVESQFLNLFGIYNLVITKAHFPASEKFVNVQPYVLDCISDREVELIL